MESSHQLNTSHRQPGPTLTISPKHFMNSPGSSTCSTTSIAHTTSNCSPASRSSSAEVCLYSNDPVFLTLLDIVFGSGRESDVCEGEDLYGRNGSCEACRFAITMFASLASTPITSPPNLAKLYHHQFSPL
jgi:hypothetical protein